MPGTPKALRAAPARTFENYTFSRVVGGTEAGLTPVSINKFTPATAGAGDNPGSGWADNGYSSPISIGFDFLFDGLVYNHFVVCTNGWMALVDPTLGTFASSEVITGNVWKNGNINATFTSKAVLLAPWFDDLRNVANDPIQITGSYGATKLARVTGGLEPPIVELNQTKFGVKYHTNVKTPRGRRLIVRWHSLSNATTTNTSLSFDVVIYESGDIEFRYAPRSNLTMVNNSGVETATIGIFMPNGTNRFRDFSAGLGYKDSFRTVYKYGGYINSAAFTDTVDGNTVGYAGGLTPWANWPSTWAAASTMVFQAPRLRRQVLPRLAIGQQDSRISMPLVGRSGDPSRLGTGNVAFDDRNTVTFTSGTVVNYPTTLPRLFGGTDPGVPGRQDLFTGDFELTGSFVKSAIDPFLIERPQAYVAPFSENKQPEQIVGGLNDFFATGSDLNAFSDTLSQRLQAKTIMRMSFPVDRPTKMPVTSSCIMYYRPKSRSWAVPTNSTYVISANATTNDSGVRNGDIANANADVFKGRITEDARGFGPIGNRVSSGSLNNSGSAGQTDANLGAAFSKTELITAISSFYGKSVFNTSSYAATPDEVFQVPITAPFLLEKAVIEVPFAMGDGWFKNRTTSFITLNDLGAFDFAGPGLTVALFNQVAAGTGTRLDLIMSGTLTHKFDSYASIVASNFSPSDPGTMYQCRPTGFNSYGGSPAAVVQPVSTSVGYVFTGSVQLPMRAAISNGVVVQVEISSKTDLGGSIPTVVQSVRNVFSSPTLPLDTNTDGNVTKVCNVASVNPLGRGGTGFDVSARSPYGKEFPTFKALGSSNAVANPFYVTGSNPYAIGAASGLPTQIEQVMDQLTGSSMWLTFVAAIPVMEHRASPYVVRPGDKLVLAISKMRPYIYDGDNSTLQPFTSGSITDDVQLITGSIEVTMYGSTLSEGTEQHDVLNQPLASNAVHETFIGGSSTVSDRFEGDYRDAYSGSWVDDVVVSSLNQTLSWNGTTGSLGRGRIFSKSAPRSAPFSPGFGPFDQSFSLSYQLQPFYEVAGTARVLKATSTTERYWDSMMPAIDRCFAADQCGIFLRDPSINPPNNTDLNFVDPTSVDITRGFIWFDYQVSSVYPTMQSLVNSNWTWAYPFEPRYSAVARQIEIQKSFLATSIIRGGTPNQPFPTITSIPPTPVPGFMFGPVGTQVPSNPRVVPPNTTTQHQHSYWISDVITNQLNPLGLLLTQSHAQTGSAGVSDIVKALFGFGDLNNMIIAGKDNSNFNGMQFGTNHFADARQVKNDSYGSPYGYGSCYMYGPVIRGWKYGVLSGLPTYTSAYFRPTHFGHFRDMLEQRPYAKLFITNDPALPNTNRQQGQTVGVVSVKFVDQAGKVTNPENTWSFNLSIEATSSMPYFDGLAMNRPAINLNTLNTNVVTISQDEMSNIVL